MYIYIHIYIHIYIQIYKVEHIYIFKEASAKPNAVDGVATYMCVR